MEPQVYFFGTLPDGFSSYPGDHTRAFFEEFLKRSKNQLQIVVHREDNLLHYGYVRKFCNNYFGICICIDKIYNDISYLFEILDDIFAEIIKKGDILKMTTRTNIEWSLKSYVSESVAIHKYSKQIINKLSISDSNTQKLSPVDFSISINDCLELSLETSKDKITEATKRYSNLYIVKTNAEIERVTGFMHIVETKNNEIEKLIQENLCLKKENKELLIKYTCLESKIKVEKKNEPNAFSSIVNSQSIVPKESNTAKSIKQLRNIKKWADDDIPHRERVSRSSYLKLILVGILLLIVLFNVIIPCLISTEWIKQTIPVTIIGISVFFFTLLCDDDYYLLRYGAILSIFSSLALIIYGICGGSLPTVIKNVTNNIETEIQKTTTPQQPAVPSKVVQIPNDYVLVPAGRLEKILDYDKDYNHIYKDMDIDSFYICKYEVTQAEWKKIFPVDTLFIYNSGYYKDSEKIIIKNDSIPVERRFSQIIQFCIQKSKQEGYDGFYQIEDGKCIFNSNGNGYRLPNKNEWIYAARGCSTRKRYITGDKLQEIAWYGGNSKQRPHPVGQKKPNGIGIYDMCGNISEVCWHDRIEKSIYPAIVMGGNYLTYFQLTENEVYYTSHESKDGFRLVFIPKKFKNHNITLLQTSYKK